MKKTFTVLAIALSLLALPAAAAELELSTLASNFGFDDDREIYSALPGFGVSASVSERISDRIDGKVSFDRDPLMGNLLRARAALHTPLLVISAGPSFGVLNSDGDKDDVSVLLQPGLGIGLKLVIPGIFIAAADTDFAIPPAAPMNGQAFLQRGELSAGFYLPNVLCTARISQRNETITHETKDATKSVTDIGLYNEAFKKGSPFRISVDFVYRIEHFRANDGTSEPVKIGNLMLGTGVTWSPNVDMSFFGKMTGSLYSFTLNEKVDDLDKFRYDLSLGSRVVVKSLKGAE